MAATFGLVGLERSAYAVLSSPLPAFIDLTVIA